MAMKKSLFVVLMLAMAGVVSSCEKEPISGVNDSNPEVSGVKDESIEVFPLCIPLPSRAVSHVCLNGRVSAKIR